ncbi:MAG: LacI family DNA-binding transcriptional regulator [Chthoniobacterales bacterium]
MPTQQAIAEMVGLSQVTVSDILKGSVKKKYSKATRRRVIEAAASLNYRPNRAAQTIRKGKSGLIGFIHTSTFMQVAVERASYASQAIQKNGYQLMNSEMVCCDEVNLGKVCDTLLDARVEGIIFAANLPQYAQPYLERIQAAGIPIVTLSGNRIYGAPKIGLDLKESSRRLTRHLIGLGYRRLTMVMPESRPESIHGFSERIQAFEEVVAEADLSEAEVVYQPISSKADSLKDSLFEPGRVATLQLLSRSKRPEAILCSNDYWAMGALRACAEKKVCVPQEIAITGFDDTDVGEYAPVSLTTIAQPTEKLAQKAVALLTSIIRGEKPRISDEVFTLPGRLVVRESCGAALRTNMMNFN